MSKLIAIGEEARIKIRDGVDIVAKIVGSTIGPKGHNVVLGRPFGGPNITNDGVTIAKDIELKDEFENIGAQLVKEVASKTDDVAGDGTTTATILTQAMISAGLKNITSGANSTEIRRGIEKATAKAVEIIEGISKKVSSKEEIEQVASISCGDNEIGKMIADVIDTVGKTGVVTVEESNSLGLSKEIVEGMQYDRGYISAYLATEMATMRAIVEDPFVLITDKRIVSISEIIPIYEKLHAMNRKELVIIASDFSEDVVTGLVVNKLRGMASIIATKAPFIGDKSKEMLQDLAVITGTEVISEETGQKLEEVEVEMLGSAKRVESDAHSTVIVGGKGTKEEINNRIEYINKQIAQASTSFESEALQERLAKLTGGVGVIKVGAATETEIKEIKYKVEDAVKATKAATEEGIVPGGGVALLSALSKVKKIKTVGDEKIGVDIVCAAIIAPLMQIAYNAGESGEVIVNDTMKLPVGEGWNAATGKFGNMFDMGIVDPAKVTRSALQNAASIAALVLTTEAIVIDDNTKKIDEN